MQVPGYVLNSLLCMKDWATKYYLRMTSLSEFDKGDEKGSRNENMPVEHKMTSSSVEQPLYAVFYFGVLVQILDLRHAKLIVSAHDKPL